MIHEAGTLLSSFPTARAEIKPEGMTEINHAAILIGVLPPMLTAICPL
jgi:hypothetical protein